MTPVIEAQEISRRFKVSDGFFLKKARYLQAVDKISFSVNRGETLGLVGESGSGKSTAGSILLRLLNADEGRVIFQGKEILSLSENEFQPYRGRLQVVFQDPQSSLDPRMTIRKIVGYPLSIRQKLRSADLEKKVADVLDAVGLSEEHMNRYPHEFSGGQRQRIGIARALITHPEFIVFDEPTSALDVSVQAQILNLIATLQKKRDYAYLFISHDLAVVRHISTRIAVMYLGSIVETAPVKNFFHKPSHPYTRALIASVPRPDPFHRQNLAVLTGDAPSPLHLPQGCRFHPRCPEAMDVCRKHPPPRIRIGASHLVDCHLYG